MWSKSSGSFWTRRIRDLPGVYKYVSASPGRKVHGGEAVILWVSYVGVGPVAEQLVYLSE